MQIPKQLNWITFSEIKWVLIQMIIDYFEQPHTSFTIVNCHKSINKRFSELSQDIMKQAQHITIKTHIINKFTPFFTKIFIGLY